jgi:ABC-type sugar transport system ATPase subunit
LARLELVGIARSFGGPDPALAGIDLDVTDGEFLTVVGPSGSGKSTLIRIIAGLETADRGALRIDGADGLAATPAARDVALVFQNPALYPHLDVWDNLAFGLRARRVPKAEVRARVEETARHLGLLELCRRRPAALSGGERQRVALGRALVRRPRLLLLDEPFSSLDAPLRAALRAGLRAHQRRLGLTTLLVTHDQDEALALGDRVAVLDRGRLLQCDTPRAVHDRPATRAVARFIGRPPMDLVPAWIGADRGLKALRIGSADSPIALPFNERTTWARPLAGRGGGPVELGLRPEHLTPCACGEAGDNQLTAAGTITRMEPHGHELWAVLHLVEPGAADVWLRLATDDPRRVGDRVAVRVDLDRACWFDPGSGQRLDPIA